jgi:RNA polymerase sigma-70 factor (ECF subfamily)
VPFFVWARTVVLQRLIEVHRQHLGAQGRDVRREVAPNWDDSVEAIPVRMARVMADATSPSLAMERIELIERVQAALERLHAPDREVLALRHFEEMSNQEVAATLGLSPAASSKRYLRALERLKEILEILEGPERSRT